MKRIDFNKILQEYYPPLIREIEHYELTHIQQGYMNNVYKFSCTDKNSEKKDYIVIFYNKNRYNSTQARAFLEEVNAVTRFLSTSGFDCRTSIELEGQHLKVIEGGRFMAIYNYLPGWTIAWESYTRRHLRSLGMQMKRMHELLSIYTERNEIKNIAKWGDYLVLDSARMREYFLDNKESIKRKLGYSINFDQIDKLVKSMHSSSKKDKYQQLIHMDFVRGNILFRDRKEEEIYEITGVLDFEKMLVGQVEIDVARTYAFLIIDCKYKSHDEINNYFMTEVGVEFYAITHFVNYFWMRDLWKHLQCNPYESLCENEHYIRLVSELKKERLIV